MEVKKSLTKENFWDDLMLKYPQAVKEFCNWIDDYKRSVNWTSFIPEAKYHDLPFEFQLGIWFRYMEEEAPCYFEVDITEFDLASEIDYYMKQRETDLQYFDKAMEEL